MRDVDTKLLRAAVALAEELNFSRAAEILHIGQSALSKQINTLEELLGCELFSRDSRGVVPTVAGERFVYEARLALLHQERFNSPARRIVIARFHSRWASLHTQIRIF